VVDVDRIDVRIGAELKRNDERIAAVIAADALHVDHFVDADDLRLDGLGDGRVHNGPGSAGVDGGNGNLRRNDIRVLCNRDREQGERARNRGHDGDDDRKPRPVYKYG